MFVTVFATVCLNLAVEGACVQEVVTDNHLSPEMSSAGCLGAQGQVSALRITGRPAHLHGPAHVETGLAAAYR
jgi:hypothetical protein